MKPGETVRLECGECLLVFHLTLAPPSEWLETQVDECTVSIEPTCCPFCGSQEVSTVATVTTSGEVA